MNMTKRCRLTDIENKIVVTCGERGNRGEENKRYKLLGIK